MSIKNSWLDYAKGLALESKRKIVHCSTEPSAYVSHGLRGYGLYCFRCGEKSFVPKDEHSLKELVQRRENALKDISGKLEIPTDSVPVSEAPDKAIVWLLQGGLTPEVATAVHGIKWHDPSQRLLIPILNKDGRAVDVLARAVFGEKPKYKYLNRTTSIHYPYYRRTRDNSYIVCTEDILSSIAVHHSGSASCSVLGTSITHEQAAELAEGRFHVYLFMDPDNAGQKGARAIRKKLSMFDVRVFNVVADRDPKYLTRDQIVEAIEVAQEI